MRKRLRCTFKDSLGERLRNITDTKDTFQEKSVKHSDSQLNEPIKQWKDIYHTLPPVCCHSIFLFILHMPSDLCDHFSVNIPSPSNLSTSQVLAQSSPLLTVSSLNNFLEPSKFYISFTDN
jgi:hypothetical protein